MDSVRSQEEGAGADKSGLVDFLADERQTATLEQESTWMGKLIDRVVKAIREAEDAGVSRYQLAIKSGVEQSALSRLVNGGRTINVESLEKICDALGIEISLHKKPKR